MVCWIIKSKLFFIWNKNEKYLNNNNNKLLLLLLLLLLYNCVVITLLLPKENQTHCCLPGHTKIERSPLMVYHTD